MSKKKQQPKRHRRVPQRTCVVCREKTDKQKLTRIVHNAEAGVVIDHTGKMNGRGAYICSEPSCWDKITTAVLDRALRTSIDMDVKRTLRQSYEDNKPKVRTMPGE